MRTCWNDEVDAISSGVIKGFVMLVMLVFDEEEYNEWLKDLQLYKILLTGLFERLCPWVH